MSGSAFGQTLQYITSIKLQELERQRKVCKLYVDETLEKSAAASDPIDRVDVLLKRIQEWTGLGTWLWQAREDRSISAGQVATWATTLETQLRQAVTRYDYAKLFGDLLNEWISSGDSLALPPVQASEETEEQPTTVAKEGKSTRQERLKQEEVIQELIFSAKKTSKTAIKDYLHQLFSNSREGEVALEKLREDIEEAGESIRNSTLSEEAMRPLIKSLLARDLLSAEKAATLKSFLDSDVIISEVTSVLNMQMAGLDAWGWPEEGVRVEMRRHLSGKYRAYMDNSIIEALLFQHIGMQWSIKLKSIFGAVLSSPAWLHDTKPPRKLQFKRRHEFLGEALPSHSSYSQRGRGGRVSQWDDNSSTDIVAKLPSGSIEAQRRTLQQNEFFLTQLPGKIQDETPYDEEPKAGQKPNQGMNAQQVLLRLISTEAALKKELYGNCTIMRADLEWFGPSLPHDSILAVFEFYGMSENWLAFFQTWLSANMLFDGASAPRARSRGVPIAHALSVFCGEAILFGMDFAVNQRASGLYVYRIYDDFWYFHHDPEICAAAWKEMKTYAELVGITFNMKKTGGVCVGQELEPSLPKGVVGWGFLVFDEKEGRFIVDQATVNTHIAELRKQLERTKSVFGYVNALNKYLEFFRRNFAQPAACFGKVHADEVVSTFGRIQREIFASTEGSVVRQIQSMIEKRFGVKDIPTGWCFLRVSEGGLEIVNPIASLLTVRSSLAKDSASAFEERKQKDEDDYNRAEATWSSNVGEETSDEFMPWEEFILGRENASTSWGSVWANLQKVAVAGSVTRMGAAAKDGLWVGRSEVEKWIMALYSDEIMKRFGTLKIVEPTLIPVGMVSAFRSAKIAWDQ